MKPGFRPLEIDLRVLWPALALLGIGLVMVASASVAVAQGATGNSLYYLYKQAMFAGLGLGAGLVVLLVPLAAWERASFWLLALALLLLALVLFPGVGREVNGARRWINLGLMQVQASEPARLLLFLYLCGYIVRRSKELAATWRGLVKPLMPIGAAVLLLLLEPDFGASAVLVGVSLLLLFLAGARLRDLAVIGAGAVALFGTLIWQAPYRLQRLMSFRDPWADALDGGFQLTQSLIAIGRGQWFGVGLGNSVQKLLYLPETHTDFIFAIYAEEFGLIGVLVLLALIAALTWAGLRLARMAVAQNQHFGAYVAYVITLWFSAQSLLNIGVNMGLLPTKGLPLPLISYGGSSLVTSCMAIALLLRVGVETRRAEVGR